MAQCLNKTVCPCDTMSTETLQRELAKEHTCYVLITCKQPVDGKIEVEMIYGGDRVLAGYLIESAQGRIGEYT